jgi:hypothetical protein
MGQQATDPNGTLSQARALGCSRRTAQRHRKKLVEAARADLHALVPQQQPLAFVPLQLAPLKMPRAGRITALSAAARAGALEKAVFTRLKEATEAGDAPAVKLFASAWKDILGAVTTLEGMAEEVLRIRRWEAQKRHCVE